VIFSSSESPDAPESEAPFSELRLAPSAGDYSYQSKDQQFFDHRRREPSLKNPKATLRVLGSILGLLVGGFVGGATGLALGLSAARHSQPSPMGSPGAGLFVVMTLPGGALLGAAAGLVAWRKIQDGPVERFSDTVTLRMLCTMVVLLAAALALGVWLVQRRSSARAESLINYQCIGKVIGRVDQFVRKEGRWPRSWSELATGPNPVLSDWEQAELPRRVSIDYGVDLEDVVRQEPPRFTAIRPIGPCVEYRTSGWIEGLQHTIRNSLRASNEAPPYSPSTVKKKLGTTKKAGTTKRGTAPTALPRLQG
jgi:hypothetical protein